MDTKWKKFKYSNGNKLLCVLLALLMVACLMLNVVQLAKFLPFYGEDVFKEETKSVYDTEPFQNIVRGSMYSIRYDLTIDARLAERDKFVDDFYAEYLKAAEESRIDGTEIFGLISEIDGDYYDVYGDIYENAYDYYCGQPNTVGQLEDGRYFYCGDDGYFYTKFMLYDKSIVDAGDSDNGVNFGHSEEETRKMIERYYYENNPNSDPAIIGYYGYGDYNSLKNILYYGVHKDGKVITNVTANTDAFIQSVKNGEGNSIAYEPAGKGYFASGNLRNKNCDVFYGSDNDFNLYLQMNPKGFTEDDICKYVYENYK
ncbi:MAG: hypothetical protein K2J55_04140, partial [Eubacterium sp.]|nr:hypothetical protein [Eubacterium sp.]